MQVKDKEDEDAKLKAEEEAKAAKAAAAEEAKAAKAAAREAARAAAEEAGEDYAESEEEEEKVPEVKPKTMAERIRDQFGLDWKKISQKLPYGRTPEQVALRRELFEDYDDNMQGFLSLIEAENGISETLGISLDVFDVRPAIRRAYDISKDIAGKGDAGRAFVEIKEFRVMLQYTKLFFEFWAM